MLDHLDTLYAADGDPWGHLTRRYERTKHARTLRAIGPGPFRSAVEVGCGIGALTCGLADVSRNVIAIDCVAAALASARARVGCRNVMFREAVVPDGLPAGRHDLIVLSEVLYFLWKADIDAVARWIKDTANPGCRVVSVNWTGPTGHVLTGPEAADHLKACFGVWSQTRQHHKGYMIDVLDCPSRH